MPAGLENIVVNVAGRLAGVSGIKTTLIKKNRNNDGALTKVSVLRMRGAVLQ